MPDFGYIYFGGGESLDPLVDGDMEWSTIPAGWDIVTSPKLATGVGAIRVHVNGSQGTTFVGNFGTAQLFQYHKWVVQSGTPTNPYCLFGDPTVAGGLCGEVSTSSKIRVVKMPASPPLWANRIPLTGWSADALATDNATLKKVGFWVDPLSLGSSNMWVVLFIDGVLQWAADIGAYAAGIEGYKFYPCPPVADAGIDVVFDDFATIFAVPTSTPSLAPHLIDWPQPQVTRQLPISDSTVGGEDAWTGVGSTTNQWANWDDPAVHDTNTYNVGAALGQNELSLGQTAATMGIADHTILVQGGAPTVGPWMIFVHRIEDSGSKWSGRAKNSVWTGNQWIAKPANFDYVGKEAFIRKDSGVWVPGDADTLRFGFGIVSDHDIPWDVTLLQVHWCSYKNVYDHTLFPTPSIGGVWPPVTAGYAHSHGYVL